jgi:RimJ/RimL family protein N-acetyltransferase
VTQAERGFVVRPAEDADIGAMAEVELTTALAAYADIFPPDAPTPTLEEFVDRWHHRLARQDDGAAVFVAVTRGDDEDKVIGVVMADPAPENEPGPDRHGNVRALYVDPGHWRRGAGRRLHDAACAYLHVSRPQLHTLSLWVLEKNRRARRRYENWGWQATVDRQTIWPGVLELRYEAKQ